MSGEVIPFPKQQSPVEALTVHTCGVCGCQSFIVVIDNRALVCAKCLTTLANCHVEEGAPEPLPGREPYEEIEPGSDV